MTAQESLDMLQGRAVQRYGNALDRRRAAKAQIEDFFGQVQAVSTHPVETWLEKRGNVLGPLPTNQQIEEAQRNLDAAGQEIREAIEDMKAASIPSSIWTDRTD